MHRTLARRLHRIHPDTIALIFAFWVAQLVLWATMMFVVQFADPALGQSVLYVTQISHWALVEAAATAAISSWTLLQAKHNARRLAAQDHDEHARIEADIARLAALGPGPEAAQLAAQITARLNSPERQ